MIFKAISDNVILKDIIGLYKFAGVKMIILVEKCKNKIGTFKNNTISNVLL